MPSGAAQDGGTSAKRRWRDVDGVLLLDKPSGITSTAALGRARRALAAAKAGHTGTLDPIASGLLPLCFGEATKFAADLLDATKAYRATARLGVVTTTGDREGEPVVTRPVDVDPSAIEAALAPLRGDIEQVPPMYSALKRDGRPLYEYARRGEVVERAARPVRIERLESVSFDGNDLVFDVTCSKGTYVRTLAESIGEALGCGAHLVALRRTAVGRWTIADAIALDALEALAPADRDPVLRPVDALIEDLPRIDLDVDLARRFGDGQRLPWPDDGIVRRVRVYALDRDQVDAAHDPSHESGLTAAATLLGTALVGQEGRLAPLRLIARRAQ